MNCFRCQHHIGLVHIVVLNGDEPGRHYCAACGPKLEDVPETTHNARAQRTGLLALAQRRIERMALAATDTTWRRPSWKR
jgi:hypothetical protein